MFINKNSFVDKKTNKEVKILNFIFNEKNVKQTKSGKAYVCTCFLDEKIDTIAGEMNIKQLLKVDLLKDTKSKLDYLKDTFNDLTDEEKQKLKDLLK